MNVLKLMLVAIALGLSTFSFSQDFTTKIRENASIVFSMNTANILKKVPEEKINVSQMFYEFKREFRMKELEKLSDLGVSFNSSMVYAMEMDSNMVYNLFFMPIEDIAKFETLISQKNNKEIPVQKQGYKSITNSRKTEHVVWNKEFAVFAFGYYTGSKYQYSYNSTFQDFDYYSQRISIEKVLRDDTARKLTLKQKSDKVDDLMGMGYYLSKYDSVEAIPNFAPKPKVSESETVTELDMVEEATEVVAIDAVGSSQNRSFYNDFYYDKRELEDYRARIRSKVNRRVREQRRELKAELVEQIFDARLGTIFNQDIKNSIQSVASFKNSQDAKADGVLWMKNNYLRNTMSSLSSAFMGSFYGRRYYNGGIGDRFLTQFSQDVSVTKLFFDKKGVRFTSTSENSKETAESMNAIYSSNQDTRLLDHVNGDNFLGYVSTSFSTEAVIREIPHLWANAYAQYAPKYQEEMSVFADFMEVFMDEKALGELATGNAMFVFKDLKEREVEYTSYEYDENYRRTKVQKTKTEFLPEFLMMFTTDNESLLNRIMKLGIKNEVISNKGNYYTSEAEKSDFPMDIFFTIKDGIVFISTDELEIKSITAGGKSKGIAKKHRKLIEKNSQVVYFNSDKTMGRFPANTVRKRDLEMFGHFRENGFEEVVITSRNENGNMVSEGVMQAPKGENNSAMYLFEFVNQFIDIANR